MNIRLKKQESRKAQTGNELQLKIKIHHGATAQHSRNQKKPSMYRRGARIAKIQVNTSTTESTEEHREERLNSSRLEKISAHSSADQTIRHECTRINTNVENHGDRNLRIVQRTQRKTKIMEGKP